LLDTLHVAFSYLVNKNLEMDQAPHTQFDSLFEQITNSRWRETNNTDSPPRNTPFIPRSSLRPQPQKQERESTPEARWDESTRPAKKSMMDRVRESAQRSPKRSATLPPPASPPTPIIPQEAYSASNILETGQVVPRRNLMDEYEPNSNYRNYEELAYGDEKYGKFRNGKQLEPSRWQKQYPNPVDVIREELQQDLEDEQEMEQHYRLLGDDKQADKHRKYAQDKQTELFDLNQNGYRYSQHGYQPSSSSD
jgi:hypothetical protein